MVDCFLRRPSGALVNLLSGSLLDLRTKVLDYATDDSKCRVVDDGEQLFLRKWESCTEFIL
jgi:hypothetical protein